MIEKKNDSESWANLSFFESNKKSSNIRLTCIPIIQKLHRLMYDPKIAENDNERRKLFSQLEQDNGALIEMGIEPGMKKNHKLEEYQKSPLLTAEYLAGQLVNLIGRNTPSINEHLGSIGENTTTLSDGNKIIESIDISPSSRDFMVTRDIFNFLKDGLAIDDSTVSNWMNK